MKFRKRVYPPISRQELQERLRWLINLRWIASGAVFSIITISHLLLKVSLPLVPLYLGNLFLILVNAIFFFQERKFRFRKDGLEWTREALRFANFQITLDLLLLTYFIYFSGGLENPFLFCFVFHMVIASILLPQRDAYLQALGAVIFVGGMTLGEQAGLLPHYHLKGFFEGRKCYLTRGSSAGIFTVFSSTLFITVFLATSIVNKLREREEELSEANRKLQEQDRLKSQYVLSVSHDLQSSLSAIQSCLKVVLSNLTGEVSEKSREMISRAEQRSRYLLHFVRDLLNLSRIRASKELEKREVSLWELVKRVADYLRPRAKEKKISLKLENLTRNSTLLANPETMEELLMNLVVNAIKYTPWGGKVGIELREKGEFLQVVVWDTGIGIPPEDIPHIFEDFYRAENAIEMEKDGTGLGLSIVRQIVAAHGGDIWVDSELGKGTRFTILLPR